MTVASREGFDFTGHVRRLCVDIAARLPELGHVDMQRVAIRYCQARKRVTWGLQASLTPLRFEKGARHVQRAGRRYTVKPIYNELGREYLYLLSFYLPRFLNHGWREKLETVIHELWHIGADFDGDLRRHEGRCHAHGPSARDYDRTVQALTERWLSLGPSDATWAFLRHDFRALKQRFGVVHGTRIATPKLIPAG